MTAIFILKILISFLKLLWFEIGIVYTKLLQKIPFRKSFLSLHINSKIFQNARSAHFMYVLCTYYIIYLYIYLRLECVFLEPSRAFVWTLAPSEYIAYLRWERAIRHRCRATPHALIKSTHTHTHIGSQKKYKVSQSHFA